jgi:hypothetical protein
MENRDITEQDMKRGAKLSKAVVVTWVLMVIGLLLAGLLASCGSAQAQGAMQDSGEDMNLVTHDVDQGKIGQSAKTVPAANAASKGQAGLGPLTGIIQFKGQTEDPQMLTASIMGADPGNTGFTYGPLTAVIQWGSGNSDTHVAEVDIQTTAGLGQLVGLIGGTVVSVPASSLEVSARNDGNFIPNVGNLPIGQPRDGAASALMAVGSRSSSGQLRKTNWAVLGTAGNGLAAAGQAAIVIPPFATGVRVFRSGGTAMVVQLVMIAGGGLAIDPINVAANTPCPFIPLSNQVLAVQVTNSGPAEITSLFGLFDIQL